MKKQLIFLIFIVACKFVIAQQTDTIKFFSPAFGTERTVFVHTPQGYKYQSTEVKLPVIYILDGQHDWFVNPILNNINYLQYTHQVPQAIVVSIPLTNRNTECKIKDVKKGDLPLLKFITEELSEQIKIYQPNQYRILIGHSFSASFALYAYLQQSPLFDAVIAHTPLDSFEKLINAFTQNPKIDYNNIYISVGGKSSHEDFYHRQSFDSLKIQYPDFFNAIHSFIADNSGHNAVPIVANPYFLTKLFSSFNARYTSIAKVDENYQLINQPISLKDELEEIEKASKLGKYFYAPEIAELNGLASRYLYSNLNNYGLAIYEMATQYYPNYYDFHLQLYDLLLKTDPKKAQSHLNKSYTLLKNLETDLTVEEKKDELEKLDAEFKKNGWLLPKF